MLKKHSLLCGFFLLFVLCFSSQALAKQKIKIAIIVMNNLTASLEGKDGVISGMKKQGFDETKIEFIVRNAENNSTKLTGIAQDLLNKKVDIVVPLGTDVAIALCKVIKDIPVVFSQVQDPVGAGISKNLKSSGNNTTGIINRTNSEALIKVLRQISPVKKLGVLYSENDVQGLRQVEEIKNLQKELGFTIVPANLKSDADAGDMVKSLVERVDSLIVCSGITITKGLDAITKAAIQFKIPTIGYYLSRAEKGLLFAVSADRFKLGELAAVKIAQIINGKNPSEIPIEPSTTYTVIVNLKTANAIGLNIPAALLKSATKITK